MMLRSTYVTRHVHKQNPQSRLRRVYESWEVSPIDNTTNYTLHYRNHSLTLARLSCPHCYEPLLRRFT